MDAAGLMSAVFARAFAVDANLPTVEKTFRHLLQNPNFFT